MALLNQAPCPWWRGLLKKLSLALFFTLLLASRGALAAETPTFKEYQIKAAFIFNFTQFVEWPTNSFTNTTAPLTIGIVGNDPFGSTLDDIVRGETINGHPLVVRRFRRHDEIKETECHILFIAQSEMGRVREILENVKSQSILTVGETEGFAKSGGIIRFVTENKKTRLRMNADAAKEAKLQISAKLLRLAEIVTTTKE